MSKVLFKDGDYTIEQRESKGIVKIAYITSKSGKVFEIPKTEMELIARVVLSDYIGKLDNELVQYRNKVYQEDKLKQIIVNKDKQYEELLKEYRYIAKILGNATDYIVEGEKING